METLHGVYYYWLRASSVAGKDFIGGMGWGWAYPTIVIPLAAVIGIVIQRKKIGGPWRESAKAIWEASKPTMIATTVYFGICLLRAPYLMEKAQPKSPEQPLVPKPGHTVPANLPRHINSDLKRRLDRFLLKQKTNTIRIEFSPNDNEVYDYVTEIKSYLDSKGAKTEMDDAGWATGWGPARGEVFIDPVFPTIKVGRRDAR